MADDSQSTTEPTQAQPRTRTSKANVQEEAPPRPRFHIVETKEPALSVSPRNPVGDILTVRAPLVVYANADGTLDTKLTASSTLELFEAMVDTIVGRIWADSTQVYLASFDPAVAHALSKGVEVGEALDIKEPSESEADAFERMRGFRGQGGGSSDRGGRGGGRSSGRRGGGDGKKPLDLDSVSDSVYDDLPKEFRDELDGGVRCPDCGGTKFWDNRDDPDRGQGPKLACANKDCEGGGKKSQGGFFPWAWFGSGDGGRRGGGGGGRRRSRGD